MSTITTELVFDDLGAVDQDGSIDKFTDGLASFISNLETENASVTSVVAEVYADHKGQTMTTPTVVSYAAAKLNLQPSNFTVMTKRIGNYLRSNSKGDNSLFVSVKGPKGGIFLRADLPVKA
jgi:hypothetical protein